MPLEFYKLSLNFNSNKTTYKELFWCLGTCLCSIWWFVFFFELLTLSTLKGHNFLNFIPSLTIFSSTKCVNRKGSSFVETPKRMEASLGFSLLWVVKCYNCNSICNEWKTKRFLPYVLSSNPCYKLYKEDLFSYVFTLKCMCHFGMSLQKLNWKAKHKIKNKISWLFSTTFSLVLSYLLTYRDK